MVVNYYIFLKTIANDFGIDLKDGERKMKISFVKYNYTKPFL